MPDKETGGTVAEYASQGGEARAAALMPEERQRIARMAAIARWEKAGKSLPVATHAGLLKLPGIECECAVLEDGTRVLTRAGFLRVIGRKGKAKGGRQFDNEFKTPVFLTAANLKPFIPEGLEENSRPIPFRTRNGTEAIGYRAELLPEVCQVFADALDAGDVLHANQKPIALQCKILLRAFVKVAITALIDEATGYQDSRAKDALAKILEAFVAKELRPYLKHFPTDFYKEMYRLRGWHWPELPAEQNKRSPLVGRLTDNLVYDRLAPGVKDRLKQLIGRDHSGRLKHKLFQRLTDDIGDPKLREHLASVVVLMKATDGWDQFMGMLDRALPKYPKYRHLPLFDGNAEVVPS